MLLKGAGVALLAVYALRRHGSTDARLLAAVMALGALGDMAIEMSMIAGGAAFLAAHMGAVALYRRNRRPVPGASQKLAAAVLLAGTPLVSFLLSSDWGVTAYSLGLGAMACTAWLSRFSRYRVGAGAVLFVVSDWLIFSRLGFVGDTALADWLIWPLYYAGQFLIATGVIQTLQRDPRDAQA